jgi:FkbM family methyltransferase
MKNPLKKLLKTIKTYIKPLATNSQSSIVRPLYLAYDLFIKRYGREYFSQFGEDIVLDNIFGHKKGGFYVDVGCYHPKHWSNTYLMHKRQWTGINIDIDEFKVQMFNIARKNSTNICSAVSNEEKDITYYCSKDYSPVNTLDQNFAEGMASKKPRVNYELKQTKSRKLDKIILETKFREREIDLLSIDVEGHELPVLQSLNFQIYKPKVLVIELHEEKIAEILKTELYEFITAKQYSLYSWVKPSLIFVRNDYNAGSAVVKSGKIKKPEPTRHAP